MAQRKRTRRRTKRINFKGMPGWSFLVFGLALGVVGMLVVQLFVKRVDTRDGLAGLLPARTGTADTQSSEPPKTAVKEPIATQKTTKPKYDFYTILPEIETVLPDRGTKSRPGVRPTTAEIGASYVLQAGSFANYQDADQLKAKLALQGLVAHIQRIIIEGKGEFHRVRLGPYEGIEDLDAASQRLQQLGISALRLKVRQGSGT